MLKLMSANDSTNSSEDDIDEYESIQEIEESLGCIDSDLGDMLDMINSDVLKDINEISHEIRQLIKSTKSIDEINNRLGEISSCIEGAGSLEAIDEG
jgi:phosphomevalonate kinase